MSTRHFVATALVALVGICAAQAEETTATWDAWSLERARSLEKIGQFEDAVEEWLALSRLRPTEVMPFAKAAVIAVEAPVARGKELAPGTPLFQLAERCVQEGVARGGKGDPALAYVIGRMRYAEGNWAVAYWMFTEAKASGFDPLRARYWLYRAAVNRAGLLIEAGEATKALGELSMLLASQPGHPDERSLLINLAAANNGLQQPKVAMQILEGILAKTPGHADAHYLVAIILAAEGRLEEAEKRFRETLLHASSAYSDGTYRNALLRLCEVEIKLGKLDDAEAAANQYLTLAKDDPQGLYALGRVMQAKGELEKAVRLFRRVARMRPETMDTLTNLKATLFELGDTEEADEVGRQIKALEKKRDAQIRGEPATMDAPTDKSSPGTIPKR